MSYKYKREVFGMPVTVFETDEEVTLDKTSKSYYKRVIKEGCHHWLPRDIYFYKSVKLKREDKDEQNG
ncbi:MAG: hypothetical protein H8D23_21670 [Candidatus Brocadiales bacterium]|nr:hypothetical protein [Candidatus Brocadiales bacterium]